MDHSGMLQHLKELRLVLVVPEVLPPKDQVTVCQLSCANWPHADVFL